MLPIEQLRESALNPRKHFDAHKLEELAGSIDDRGVITPLIVREAGRLAMKGLPDSVVYEIAAGHRRYRAAKSLGRSIPLPCRIMILDDDEFLEVVTIENLQREDIHPLEEADGYKALLATGRYQEPDFHGEEIRNLADKIGKTENYVRGRLELCDLAEPARQGFLDSRITIGHARLISRVPAARQEEAYGLCFERSWRTSQEELEPIHEFRRKLKQALEGQDLAKAPFALDDATLKRDAGPCTVCPKTTGLQRSLLAEDSREALCLDGACYSQKLNAHIMRKTSAGVVAISLRSSGDIAPGTISASEYVIVAKDVDRIRDCEEEIQAIKTDPSDPEDDARQIEQLEKEIAEAEAEEERCLHAEPAVVVQDWSSNESRIGDETYICRNPKCPKHGEDVSRQNQIGSGRRDRDPKDIAAEEKRKCERKLDQAIRRRSWETLLGAVEEHGQVNERVLYLAATGFIHEANRDFCKAFGIEAAKDDWQPARKWITKATEAQLIKFIVAAALSKVGLSEYFDKQYSGKDEWHDFRDTLAEYDLDYKAIEKDVREELKTKAAKQPKAKRAGK